MAFYRQWTMKYAPFAELKNEKIAWKHLFKPEDEKIYGFMATDKDIYVYTPKGAPKFKILKMSMANPDLKKAETFIPEDPGGTIVSAGLTSDGDSIMPCLKMESSANFYSSHKEKKQQKKLNCHLQLVLFT